MAHDDLQEKLKRAEERSEKRADKDAERLRKRTAKQKRLEIHRAQWEAGRPQREAEYAAERRTFVIMMFVLVGIVLVGLVGVILSL